MLVGEVDAAPGEEILGGFLGGRGREAEIEGERESD
jgi:hypothetical protein